MSEKFICATKEAAFEGDAGEIRAIRLKGSTRELESLIDGYAYDNSAINTKSFDAQGNLGVVKLDIESTCMGALSLGDSETLYMGLGEAKELREVLDAAISEAASTLEELWEKKEDLCPI